MRVSFRQVPAKLEPHHLCINTANRHDEVREDVAIRVENYFILTIVVVYPERVQVVVREEVVADLNTSRSNDKVDHLGLFGSMNYYRDRR